MIQQILPIAREKVSIIKALSGLRRASCFLSVFFLLRKRRRGIKFETYGVHTLSISFEENILKEIKSTKW
jgi:hypothetical protein